MTSGAKLPYDQKTYRALIPVGKTVGAFIDFERVASLPPESFGPERDTDVSFVMVIKNSANPLEEVAELTAEIESGTGCPVLPHTPPTGAGGGVIEAATNIAFYIATDLGEEASRAAADALVSAVKRYFAKQIAKLKKDKVESPAFKYREHPVYGPNGQILKVVRVKDYEIVELDDP